MSCCDARHARSETDLNHYKEAHHIDTRMGLHKLSLPNGHLCMTGCDALMSPMQGTLGSSDQFDLASYNMQIRAAVGFLN